MESLTQRQQQVLTYIQQCQQDTGGPPSMREIANHFHFSSANAARDHIQALIRKGALKQRPGQARALQVITPLPSLNSRTLDIPFYGNIPAGFADGRAQESEGCITVDIDVLGLHPTTRTFALQVRGDSMVGKHILDGDFVVCEHGVTPKVGDIVAALIDNESTLKTFLRKGRKPYLRAENPNYPELIPAAELVIQGIVVAIIRKLRNHV